MLEKSRIEFRNYDPAWQAAAENMIGQLKNIFGENASDIAHIGGTAMKKIKSKPIIDIVAGLDDINSIGSFEETLKTQGFICVSKNPDISHVSKVIERKIFKYGRTHVIHVVQHNSKLWFDYIIFRDYLNINENKAREYEALKLSVNGKYKSALPSFIKAKSDFIKKAVKDNFFTMMLGKTVTVSVKEKQIKNLKRGAYIIGDNESGEFTGKITAYTRNTNEKKFIVAKDGEIFYKPDILEALKIYDLHEKDIVCMHEKSCGAVVYAKDKKDNGIKFLLVKGRASSRIGFPKGHVEKGESETETAIREIYEETSLKNIILRTDFREEYSYVIGGYVHKKVVYFLAEFNASDKYQIQDTEILEQRLVSYEKAYHALTFNQDKTILKKALEKIK